ncbi:MAG: hypothetical protein ACR2MS_06370 [Weeksellaceae bacterium]
MKVDFSKLITLLIVGLILYKLWKYVASDFKNDYLKIQLWGLTLAVMAYFGFKIYKNLQK